MDEYSITDYKLFETGAITSNHLRENLSSYKDKIQQCKDKLKEETIIFGPAADNINEVADSLGTAYDTNMELYDKIAIKLTDIFEHYKNGDEEGAKKLVESCVTDSAGISLTAQGTGTDASTSTTQPGTTAPTAKAQEMIDRALSVVGSSYSPSGYYWTGDTSSSWFTCSGLVDYALGLPEHSNWPESLRDTIGRENLTTDVSKLKPGDLVFYEYFGSGHSDGWGHVGIYIGNNQIVDSANEGVRIRDVNWMTLLGGGTYPA